MLGLTPKVRNRLLPQTLTFSASGLMRMSSKMH